MGVQIYGHFLSKVRVSQMSLRNYQMECLIQAPVPVGQRLPSKEGIILKFFVDLKISVERNYAAAQ
jgi:hypothetical protein